MYPSGVSEYTPGDNCRRLHTTIKKEIITTENNYMQRTHNFYHISITLVSYMHRNNTNKPL